MTGIVGTMTTAAIVDAMGIAITVAIGTMIADIAGTTRIATEPVHSCHTGEKIRSHGGWSALS